MPLPWACCSHGTCSITSQRAPSTLGVTHLRAAPLQIMTNLMKIASYLAHGILSTGEPIETSCPQVTPRTLLLPSPAASLASLASLAWSNTF